MRPNIRNCAVMSAVLAVGGIEAQAGGDFNQGEAKALQCVSCHGELGLTPNPMFPHLAGQNASYLEMQLEYFRTGQRYHPVMSPIAEALSRKDIEDLATYYSAIKAPADER